MSIATMADIDNSTDEEYVIHCAKYALQSSPVDAKAWMITAKSLYPNNFGVQFEAYRIEKDAGHLKEAAKCFSDLIGKFQQQPEFWDEISNVTFALRAENDNTDPEKLFLCEMFKHISLEVQHKLLLLTADHCEDTQEHCKLLLLLLERFPSSISIHGPGLVETLLSAEKHSHAGNRPINCYRKLLVCDLLPLLYTQSNVMELPQKLVYKLLHKSIEYYLSILRENTFTYMDTGTKSEDVWTKLFRVIEFVGNQLGWESHLTSFGNNWCKESYWQKLVNFCQSQSLNLEDPTMLKQLVYCLTMFLIHCLHQYVVSICPNSSSGHQTHQNYLLVEAFVDQSYPNPHNQEPKPKRRKTDVDLSLPYITTEKPNMKNILANFMMAVNCWDLLHSAEHLNREFMKISSILMMEPWLTSFLVDYLIYKRKYEDANKRLDTDLGIHPLVKNVLKGNILFLQHNYTDCLNHICETINNLPIEMGTISTKLICGGSQRHLHFIELTEIGVLQFFCKILLRSIKQNGFKNDVAVGHCFVLMQLDWPQEEDMLTILVDQIVQTRSFYYLCFQNYIVEVDILEELAYLWGAHGGQVSLEIIPNMVTRRIGTRGADKGMKEDIKQALRRQVSKCNDPIHEILKLFLMQERLSLSNTLV